MSRRVRAWRSPHPFTRPRWCMWSCPCCDQASSFSSVRGERHKRIRAGPAGFSPASSVSCSPRSGLRQALGGRAATPCSGLRRRGRGDAARVAMRLSYGTGGARHSPYAPMFFPTLPREVSAAPRARGRGSSVANSSVAAVTRRAFVIGAATTEDAPAGESRVSLHEHHVAPSDDGMQNAPPGVKRRRGERSSLVGDGGCSSEQLLRTSSLHFVIGCASACESRPA